MDTIPTNMQFKTIYRPISAAEIFAYECSFLFYKVPSGHFQTPRIAPFESACLCTSRGYFFERLVRHFYFSYNSKCIGLIFKSTYRGQFKRYARVPWMEAVYFFPPHTLRYAERGAGKKFRPIGSKNRDKSRFFGPIFRNHREEVISGRWDRAGSKEGAIPV